MNQVIIDAERCKECEYCIHFCPQKTVLGKSERVNKKGYYFAMVKAPEDCIGCGVCAVVCPEIAVQVKKETPDSCKP